MCQAAAERTYDFNAISTLSEIYVKQASILFTILLKRLALPLARLSGGRCTGADYRSNV